MHVSRAMRCLCVAGQPSRAAHPHDGIARMRPSPQGGAPGRASLKHSPSLALPHHAHAKQWLPNPQARQCQAMRPSAHSTDICQCMALNTRNDTGSTFKNSICHSANPGAAQSSHAHLHTPHQQTTLANIVGISPFSHPVSAAGTYILSTFSQA